MRELIADIRAQLARGDLDEPGLAKVRASVQQSADDLCSCGVTDQVCSPGRYLCYRDPDYGFVVMLMVWGEGDGTPIHDHGTWGVEIVIRSQLKVTAYDLVDGIPEAGPAKILNPGDVMSNMPPDRDLHKVEQHGPGPSASLHIYGGAMDKNRVYVPGKGFRPCDLTTIELGHEVESLGLPTMQKSARA